MGEIVLVTGGARSGKSRFAEQLLDGYGSVLYVATAVACDGEMEERIRRHRAGRNPGWATIEAFSGLGAKLRPALAGRQALLFDCLTLMLTNLMLQDPSIDWDTVLPGRIADLEEQAEGEVDELLAVMGEFAGKSVIVSNELGLGLVPAYPLGRYFRDLAGRINQKAAARADKVYFMVAGLPLIVKG